MEENIEGTIEKVMERIVKRREEKGYSLENMANELGLSLSAYNKIEKQQTKLTLERLLQIRIILEIPLQELLDIKGNNVYHQKLNGSSTGYQAGRQNLRQDNEHLSNTLIKSLQSEIEFLRTILKRSLDELHP